MSLWGNFLNIRGRIPHIHNSSSLGQMGPSHHSGGPASCQALGFSFCASLSWRPQPYGHWPLSSLGLVSVQDSCSWLPELGPRIIPVQSPLSPLLGMPSLPSFSFVLPTRGSARAGPDQTGMSSCVYSKQRENWVLALPGGDGGGGTCLSRRRDPSCLLCCRDPHSQCLRLLAGPRRLDSILSLECPR